MTGAELKTFAEGLYDDTIDTDLFYNILNMCKDEVELWVNWEYLKKIDSSKTLSPSDNWLTMKDLPTDFREPLGDVYCGINLSGVYRPIPFEKRNLYNSSSFKYYIDYRNRQFALIGSQGSAQTIYLPYICTSDDIEAATSWSFPTFCHKLLAIMTVAYIENGVDVDDIFARMSQEQKMMALALKTRMLRWNSKLAGNANDYSSSPFLTSDNPVDDMISNLSQM